MKTKKSLNCTVYLKLFENFKQCILIVFTPDSFRGPHPQATVPAVPRYPSAARRLPSPIHVELLMVLISYMSVQATTVAGNSSRPQFYHVQKTLFCSSSPKFLAPKNLSALLFHGVPQWCSPNGWWEIDVGDLSTGKHTKLSTWTSHKSLCHSLPPSRRSFLNQWWQKARSVGLNLNTEKAVSKHEHLVKHHQQVPL